MISDNNARCKHHGVGKISIIGIENFYRKITGNKYLSLSRLRSLSGFICSKCISEKNQCVYGRISLDTWISQQDKNYSDFI